MKNNIDRLIDEAFADELLQLAPEQADDKKIAQQVFSKLGLQQPASSTVTELAKYQPKRKKLRILLIAALLILLTATGVLAASGILKLGQNPVEYFAPHRSTVPGDDIIEQAKPENSHDTEEPLFHVGLEAATQKLNTPVGKTIHYEGVTLTLDTIALDSNFVVLFFTAEYDKAINFAEIYPNEYPGNGTAPAYPEYTHLLSFFPSFWMDINQDARPEAYWPSSEDGYFVDDRTIRFSLRYILTEQYPDELTVFAKAYSVRDANGNELMGQRVETEDANPFTFQVSVDKSEERPYCRAAEQAVYTINTETGEQMLSLERLSLSPFGTTIAFHVEAPQDSHEIDGLHPYMLYMEDDKGNVINTYDDPMYGNHYLYAGTCTTELIGISPEAESITFTPLIFSNESSQSQQYAVDGIVGQKIETSSLGGYTVRKFTVRGRTIEVELQPYGYIDRPNLNFDTENITMAGGKSGMQREHYNRETNIFTFAVDYYAATEEELKAVETFSVWYEYVELDKHGSLTLPITEVYDHGQS